MLCWHRLPVSEQAIEDRRARFKIDVRKFSASSVVDRHVIFGDCYILDKDSYFNLKEQIAGHFRIHPPQVVMVGSGKLGLASPIPSVIALSARHPIWTSRSYPRTSLISYGKKFSKTGGHSVTGPARTTSRLIWHGAGSGPTSFRRPRSSRLRMIGGSSSTLLPLLGTLVDIKFAVACIAIGFS